MNSETSLSLDVSPTVTDSEKFAQEVVGIMRCVVSATTPAQVCVIKVDNWFGFRWLAFSHKVIGAFGLASYDLVVPPFVPNRIEAEILFTRQPSGDYEQSRPSQPVHIEQVSGANAARKLSSLFPNVAFFWWSGRSAVNHRGSLMAYLPTPEGHVPWYIGFSAENGWTMSQLKGISRSELESYRTLAAESRAI